MKYASKDWKAVESSDLIGREHKLSVTGQVETLNTNETPKLAPAEPQGIVAQELILELTIEKHGDVGGHIVRFVPVAYERKISSGQYHTVSIRGETKDVVIKVERVLS